MIPLVKPYMAPREELMPAIEDVLYSGYIAEGEAAWRFEDGLKDFLGNPNILAVQSGTAALHLALLLLNVESGDEVISTPMTSEPTNTAIAITGAKVVWADVDPDTGLLDPESVRKKITERTKAVIAVDFTGQAAELGRIREICRRHHLILIEDAAHALGTKYDGIPVGNIADLTTFSFHPVKTCTAGEGGAILTNEDALYQKLTLFRTHGITRAPEAMDRPSEGGWYYQQLELGFNYRMTDLQAALLASQLDKLEAFGTRRKELVKRYDDAFSKMPELTIQKEIPQSDTVRHLYLLQLNLEMLRCTRREVFEALQAEGVGVNVHYIPVYSFPYYQKLGYEMGSCPNAEHLYERLISIPLFYSMTDEEANQVIAAVQKVIHYFKA